MELGNSTAASARGSSSMLHDLLWLLVIIAIAGVLLWGLEQFPSMDATFKQIARVIVIVVVSIYAIITLFHILSAAIPGLR